MPPVQVGLPGEAFWDQLIRKSCIDQPARFIKARKNVLVSWAFSVDTLNVTAKEIFWHKIDKDN